MSDEHGSDFVDELMEFLLRNYYSMMIKRVKRFFPNKFDAEDIVTETIIVLLENKSAVAAHEAPIKWLQTTLTHRVKQNSRIAKRNSEMFVRWKHWTNPSCPPCRIQPMIIVNTATSPLKQCSAS